MYRLANGESTSFTASNNEPINKYMCIFSYTIKYMYLYTFMYIEAYISSHKYRY
jgi:hypothetical protein